MTTSLFAFVWFFHPRAGGPPFLKIHYFPPAHLTPPPVSYRYYCRLLTVCTGSRPIVPHIFHIGITKDPLLCERSDWASGQGKGGGERTRWIMHFCGWPKIALGLARKVCAWNQQIFFGAHTYLGISMSVHQHWQAIELIKHSLFCYLKNSAFLPYFTHAQYYMSD